MIMPTGNAHFEKTAIQAMCTICSIAKAAIDIEGIADCQDFVYDLAKITDEKRLVVLHKFMITNVNILA